MKTVYICSPYRAKDKQELKRNKNYAKKLTRIALDSGFAPVTPHLYITKVTNEDSIEDRRSGMAAGIELLKRCDIVIVGDFFGLSEGMAKEIAAAKIYHKGLVYIEHFNCADQFIEEANQKSKSSNVSAFL